MFTLLLMAIAALGGAVIFLVFSGSSLETLQGPPMALAVIGALVLLYLLSHHSHERRSGRVPAMLALAAIMILAGITTRIDPAPLLKNFLAAPRGGDDATISSRATPASVRIRKMADGFIANGDVNGQSLEMLVDSGAATIVLRQSDAEKAGIDIRHLAFDTPLKTANGTSYLAPVQLKSVRVGQVSVEDVEALVAKPGTLNENLLGMSFLRRLTSYQVAGDFITLRQ